MNLPLSPSAPSGFFVAKGGPARRDPRLHVRAG